MNTINLIMKGKNVLAKGTFNVESKEFQLKKESLIKKNHTENFKYFLKRNSLIKKYCEECGESYRLNKDIYFNSPTGAAKFCLGYEVNGLICWRNAKGEKLKDIL